MNKRCISFFSFLPDSVETLVVNFSSLFVGEGWHLTLGLLFMIIVIFLPGGLMQGFEKIKNRLTNKDRETNSG